MHARIEHLLSLRDGEPVGERSIPDSAALSVARSAIPPTIHHLQTDEACGVDVVANQGRSQKLRVAVSTSLGFGGNDSAVVFRAVN